MLQIISDPTEEQIKMFESWDPSPNSVNPPPIFEREGDQYIVSIPDLENMISFKTFL